MVYVKPEDLEKRLQLMDSNINAGKHEMVNSFINKVYGS
jgi:hypothetical protein